MNPTGSFRTMKKKFKSKGPKEEKIKGKEDDIKAKSKALRLACLPWSKFHRPCGPGEGPGF